MLSRCFSSLIRVYQHHLPNPPGFEARYVQVINNKDRRIKSKIVQCDETYQNMARIVVPEDKTVHVKVTYHSRHVLGCYLPPVSRVFQIYRDDVKKSD